MLTWMTRSPTRTHWLDERVTCCCRDAPAGFSCSCRHTFSSNVPRGPFLIGASTCPENPGIKTETGNRKSRLLETRLSFGLLSVDVMFWAVQAQWNGLSIHVQRSAGQPGSTVTALQRQICLRRCTTNHIGSSPPHRMRG